MDITSKKILLTSSSIEELIVGSADETNKAGMKTDDDLDGYPLGLAYLHSSLEKAGHEVDTLFLNNYGFEYCFERTKEEIERFRPDVVGFQMLTQNRISSFKIIDYIHNNYPDIMIIIGGIHATIMHEQLARRFPFAFLILGESEITSVELVNELFSETSNLHSVKGIAFYENNAIIQTERRPLIENLDEILYPKHEIFFRNKRKIGIVLTARGCPFSCSFCCLDRMTNRRVRYRDISRVVDEIEWMIKKFPQMTEVWIQDDTFFIDNARVIRFCDEVMARGIKLNFVCSARFKPISRELVEKIEQANFKRIFFGLESGDNEILKNCHKSINQNDIISAIKLFRNSNINIYAHLIVGLPGETIETIKTTAKLVQRIQRIKYIFYQTAYLLTVYPGTEVYEIAKAKNFLADDYWLTDNPTPVYTAENSLAELYRFREILLDRIAALRAFTKWSGFKNQYYMIPYHLAYIFRNKINAKVFFYNIIRLKLSDKTFDKLKKFYKSFSSNAKIMKNILRKIKSLLFKIKNKILMKKSYKVSYSQNGEDLIMDFFFREMGLKKISYLEIGAYHPTKINNTYLFYKNGSSGVCVEPDPFLFARFKRYRKNDTCLNIGIAANDQASADFYIMSSQTLNTFSREEAERMATIGDKKIEKVIKVDLKNINHVIEKYFKTCPNLIEIDVEGLDMEILRSLDLSKYRPEAICVETITYAEDGTEEKETEIIDYLKQAGYMIYADTYINTIFVEEKKWRNRRK